MSSQDIGLILENSRELDRLRKEQEDVLVDINKLHKKLQITPEVVEKPGDTSLAKLKSLYTQAKDLSESEVSVSGTLLIQLDALLPSGPPGQQRRRIDSKYLMRSREMMKIVVAKESTSCHVVYYTFPKRNDLSGVPDFPPGRHVLAVYPGTTALYKATVVSPFGSYLLEFDDDEEDGALPQRTVPFHKVVPYRRHRQ
uniref:SGF29 C-terminal domain-containing protein n=1 Tax=Salix viminalis TaxID=40686 RepID=A0A6N2M9X1_SALVM